MDPCSITLWNGCQEFFTLLLNAEHGIIHVRAREHIHKWAWWWGRRIRRCACHCRRLCRRFWCTDRGNACHMRMPVCRTSYRIPVPWISPSGFWSVMSWSLPPFVNEESKDAVTFYRHQDSTGDVPNLSRKQAWAVWNNRVGGIYPPSHTTVRAVRHTAVQRNFIACRSL